MNWNTRDRISLKRKETRKMILLDDDARHHVANEGTK